MTKASPLGRNSRKSSSYVRPKLLMERSFPESFCLDFHILHFFHFCFPSLLLLLLWEKNPFFSSSFFSLLITIVFAYIKLILHVFKKSFLTSSS